MSLRQYNLLIFQYEALALTLGLHGKSLNFVALLLNFTYSYVAVQGMSSLNSYLLCFIFYLYTLSYCSITNLYLSLLVRYGWKARVEGTHQLCSAQMGFY